MPYLEAIAMSASGVSVVHRTRQALVEGGVLGGADQASVPVLGSRRLRGCVDLPADRWRAGLLCPGDLRRDKPEPSAGVSGGGVCRLEAVQHHSAAKDCRHDPNADTDRHAEQREKFVLQGDRFPWCPWRREGAARGRYTDLDGD